MRRVVLLCLVALTCACGNGLAQRQAFLNQFIGQSDQALVQKLGVPNRTYTTGAVKYLAYDESRVALLPPLPPTSPGPWWFNGGYGGGPPPQALTLKCETTFMVTDGVVKSYTLRGNACG